MSSNRERGQRLSSASRSDDLFAGLLTQAETRFGVGGDIVLPGRYELHEAQNQIKSKARRFNVVNCGRRFGKSILGTDLAIDPALEGFPVGWFSPDYKSLLEVWRDLCRILRDVTVRKSEQEKRIELITGGVIEMWALDADPECSRGRKYKRVIVDEAAKVRWLMRAWKEAIRPNLADYAGDAWFMSTPKGRNDYYDLYQKGVDPAELEWGCWKMPTSANTSRNEKGELNLQPDEIEAMRKELGPRIASQEVDAEFLEVGGRFFDEWILSEFDKESAHEIWAASVEIPSHWDMWGGYDWGKAAPASFHLGTSDERGNVIIAGEFYAALKSNQEQAVEIARVIERWGRDPRFVTIWADPSIFPPKDPAKRVGRYTAEDFWDAGLRMAPANNDRVNGWSRVKEYMRYRDPLSGVAGVRVLKDRCPNLVRTIPLMIGLERNPEDCDTMLEDHAVDSGLRYLIQRPHPSRPKPEEDVERGPVAKALIGFKSRSSKHFYG